MAVITRVLDAEWLHLLSAAFFPCSYYFSGLALLLVKTSPGILFLKLTEDSMEYLRSTLFASKPSKPSPLHQSATPESGPHAEHPGSPKDHLTPPSVEAQDSEPPPFIPPPDDLISLNMVLENGVHETGPNRDGKERQQLAHAAAVDRFGQIHPRQPLQRSRSHDALTSVRSNGQLRRSSTAPPRRTKHTPEQFMEIKEPAPQDDDLPSIDSALGSDDANSPSTASSQSRTGNHADVFQDDMHASEGSRHEDRPPLQKPVVPHEIGLRKATVPTISFHRSVSASSKESDHQASENEQINFETPDRPVISRKSSLAEAAVTRTAVHLFLPDEANELDRSSSMPSGGQRRVSATLQVVRSPASVYEVIWEDSMSATAKDPHNEPRDNSRMSRHTEPSQNPPRQTNTKLATWSWGVDHQIEDEIYDLRPRTPTIYVDARSQNEEEPNGILVSQDKFARNNKQPLFEKGERKGMPAQERAALDMTSLQSAEEPDKDTKPFDEPPVHRRIRPLRPRHLSNLAVEEEHFQSHRDFLKLAYERLLHKEKDGLDNHAFQDESEEIDADELDLATVNTPKFTEVSQGYSRDQIDSGKAATAVQGKTLDLHNGDIQALSRPLETATADASHDRPTPFLDPNESPAVSPAIRGASPSEPDNLSSTSSKRHAKRHISAPVHAA